MSVDTPPADTHLLSLCAILRWFNRELLIELADEVGAPLIVDVLDSNHVEPADAPDGMLRLTDARRDEICGTLHRDTPRQLIKLHSRAFHYFRELMIQEEHSKLIHVENACFYHLEKLFYLLYPHRAWGTILEHVASMRAVEPQQTRNRQRLTLYEGYLAINTGDYERGRSVLQGLLKQPVLELYTEIRALNALAHAHFYQAQYDRALTHYNQVHRVARDTGDQFHQAVALVNMGITYNNLNYYERALDVTQQSLDLYRRIGDTQREAYVLYEIANNALRLGRWNTAERHLDEALALARAHSLQARLPYIYAGFGFFHHMHGRYEESEAAYLAGIQIAQSLDDYKEVSDLYWYLGVLYHTQERWHAALRAYQRALTLAQQLHRPHWQSVILHRCGDIFAQRSRLTETRVLFQQAIDGIEQVHGDTDNEEIKIGLLGTTQQLYEAMVLLHIEEDRDTDAFNYVERARSRAFLDMLAQKAPELYARVDQPVVALDDVQAALPDDALLLEYYTTGVVPPGDNIINNLPPDNERLREYLVQPAHLFCFAVTHDQFHVYEIPLDPNLLQPKSAHSSPTRRLLRPRQLTHLYETLIAPVDALLRDKNLLYIIPHGPLHYVPWMALRSPAGDYLLAANGPAIALVPSATILLRNCLGREPAHDGDFLALGYNDEGEDALQYAETEAAFLARLMAGEAWTGARPKTQRLTQHDDPIRWLHVSGHGIFHPHAPLDSELRLGKDDAPSARDIMDSLDLSGASVTLSACTSGLTHIVAGDELLGLPRAFLYAGAPTVVCTPWEAADLVALLVMERFYRELRDDVPPAHALRDAQVAVRTMTGRDLLATLTRWRRRYPDELSSLEIPTLSPQDSDRPIFADPSHWALFTLIGRPY